jgi:oxygen-independent coproporphyrinogen-3 oxidase
VAHEPDRRPGPRPLPQSDLAEGGNFGVYVHVPFCASRCDYCDFATWTDRAHLIDDYVDACVADVEQRFARGLPAATTVFFGGGTPSLLPAARLTRVLAAIPLAAGAEVTVECNPDSVDPAKLAAYRAAGVNRVSFGVQSMRPHVLAALGRTHEPVNVARAVTGARAAGFDTFNLDVILGTPGETPADWRATLDGVLALEPPHVSAYALTVEPATPLGRRVAAGAPGPDDDDQAAKYEVADERLTAAGLAWYEISNWARPGHECRHNLLYWSQGDYLGIGCAAHGHTTSAGAGGAGRNARRWWNVRTPERYVERVRAGLPPEIGEERLERRARAEEAFGLALRTRAGAPLTPVARPVAVDLARAGLLETGPLRPGPLAPGGDAGRAVLTRRGRLLASDVTVRLLAAAGTGAGAGAGTEGAGAPGWHSVHSSANGSTPVGPAPGIRPGVCTSPPPVPIHLERTGRPSTPDS